MDFLRPVQAVIPGVQGRVLAVLTRTTSELGVRTIADLAAASPAQASRVLAHLASLGIVERRDVGRSALFRLVEGHVAGRMISELADVRDRAIRELAESARAILPAPASVTLFGSMARGDAHADSDVDVVVVRPRAIAEEDEPWADAVAGWAEHVRLITGNDVNVVHVGEDEVPRLLRSRRQLWRDVRRDGIVLAGVALAEIATRRRSA